jgi:hypothetical protein
MRGWLGIAYDVVDIGIAAGCIRLLVRGGMGFYNPSNTEMETVVLPRCGAVGYIGFLLSERVPAELIPTKIFPRSTE